MKRYELDPESDFHSEDGSLVLDMQRQGHERLSHSEVIATLNGKQAAIDELVGVLTAAMLWPIDDDDWRKIEAWAAELIAKHGKDREDTTKHAPPPVGVGPTGKRGITEIGKSDVPDLSFD